MKSKVCLLLLSIALIIASCSKNRHEEFGKDLAKAFKSKKYKNFDTTAYFAVFKSRLSADNNEIHNPITIKKIYSTEEKGLTLIGEFLIKGQLDTLVSFLEKADEHGLDPQYFHTNVIKELINRAKTEKFKYIKLAYPVLADIELYCADGLINYANFMTYGAVNPKTVLSRYYVSVDRPDILSAEKSLEQLNLVKFLNGLSSKDKPYKTLQKLLVNDKLKPTLNPAEKVKIYYSLERLRWRTKAYPAKYLFVNIPEFKLRLINNESEEFAMKVCVGEAANDKSNHQTPILSGLINLMQVNPVWNIPKSIVVKEIGEGLKNNSNYLEEKNMVAYQNGNLIDENSVDWNSVDVAKYEFKQNPGADNSLGQIKFIFKNNYAIYLHDTPNKAAFNLPNRAVSHGCVRVQQPIKLVEALVSSKQEIENIKRETTLAYQGGKAVSRWVKAKTPIPVYIEYYTAWADANGKLIIANDVYNYDKKLFDALKQFLPQ